MKKLLVKIKLPLALIILITGGAFLVGLSRVDQTAEVPTYPNPLATNQQAGGKNTPSVQQTGVRPTASQATERSTNLQNAPKQAEVRSRTTTEFEYHVLRTANDPTYASNWILQKVNAPAAWDIATGNNQTVVAVIDTGFALSHEELASNWKTNSGEIGTTQAGDVCWTGTPQNKQTNNCDDDANGYVDDYRGWNFTDGTNLPQAGKLNPTGQGVSHGTEVSGLVGATGNNAKGVATINWSTKLMPLQALDDNGTGYTSDVAAAVYYATDNGANVINMSLGGDQFDQTLSDAILYAYQHNVVVVVAAGNCGSGTEGGCNPQQPGAMSYPSTEKHVISVGATNQSDVRASFGSYGAALDISAPGAGTITSTAWTAGNNTTAYAGNLNGTSFAAPQVSSLVSLVKSIRPNTTVDDITAIVLGSATKLGAMNGQMYAPQYGHGVLNASQALTVTASLGSTTNAVPLLLQTGGSGSEHGFGNESMSSGCQVAAATYCTIWMKDQSTGYDRYLPYVLSNGSGRSGWSWGSASLGSGTWSTRAVQGQNISDTPYWLFAK